MKTKGLSELDCGKATCVAEPHNFGTKTIGPGSDDRKPGDTDILRWLSPDWDV